MRFSVAREARRLPEVIPLNCRHENSEQQFSLQAHASGAGVDGHDTADAVRLAGHGCCWGGRQHFDSFDGNQVSVRFLAIASAARQSRGRSRAVVRETCRSSVAQRLPPNNITNSWSTALSLSTGRGQKSQTNREKAAGRQRPLSGKQIICIGLSAARKATALKLAPSSPRRSNGRARRSKK
mgnify:CR=1 FL=1